MKSMIVTYDLCAPGRDYSTLIEQIKKHTVWAKITESTYFIKTSESCIAIRDQLKRYIDANDRLFVGELTGVAAWSNVQCKDDYLKDNL